ncbi:MAG TPA: YifB family Mg chelatase-like AAA ATPase [Candidatus Solibacter sp.]|nr:YifB family Mg chelatase-like AAA ATPase [Candidatus Solibacter sp.]
MIASSLTACLDGIQARRVDVEADIAAGLPSFSIVGLTDKAVQEARERVRSALRNSGFGFPGHRLTVNLAPAELRKEGSAFDLAIAVAILRSIQLPGLDGDSSTAGGSAFIGELGLDGSIRPVRGALALGTHLAARGVRRLYAPTANAAEAAGSGLPVHPVGHLTELVAHLRGETLIPVQHAASAAEVAALPEVDLADIEDQAVPKRALEIAAAGGHHLLFTGPPGAGKSMLARAFAGLLPDLSVADSKEVTTIHSIAGVLRGGGMMRRPPLRSPHHSVSLGGLIGGGASFMPGDLTLAHRGVLVLDELPEFRRDCLEALREPLEEGRFRVSRAGGTRVLPADFVLVATANPCACGVADAEECRCAPDVLARYQRKVSGPLRDRLDLIVQVGAVTLTGVRHGRVQPESGPARARVEAARERQAARQGAGILNSAVPGAALGEVCRLDGDAEACLRTVSHQFGLTGRGFHGVLRVARSIADVEGHDRITTDDLLEACAFRLR